MFQAATTITITVSLVFSITLETGIASQYSPNVMRRVVVARQQWGQLPAFLPEVDGYIAVES